MGTALFWLCLTNTALLILHEIDAAYWQEWRLFRRIAEWPLFRFLDEMEVRNGLSLFLAVHLPLLVLLLAGLVRVAQGSGLVYSLLLSVFLIFHAIAHFQLSRKGGEEFDVPISQLILTATFFVSIAQLFFTAKSLLG